MLGLLLLLAADHMFCDASVAMAIQFDDEGRSASASPVSAAALNAMTRAATGFFVLHAEIFLSLRELQDLKAAVETLCTALSPSATLALLEAGLTADIGDSVVEAVRARARRSVNMQRRKAERERTTRRNRVSVAGGNEGRVNEGPESRRPPPRKSRGGRSRSGLGRGRGRHFDLSAVNPLDITHGTGIGDEEEEESETLLEYFVAEDAAGFHSFLQTGFAPSRLDWAHFHLMLGEAGLPPPPADAARLYNDFLLKGRLQISHTIISAVERSAGSLTPQPNDTRAASQYGSSCVVSATSSPRMGEEGQRPDAALRAWEVRAVFPYRWKCTLHDIIPWS